MSVTYRGGRCLTPAAQEPVPFLHRRCQTPTSEGTAELVDYASNQLGPVAWKWPRWADITLPGRRAVNDWKFAEYFEQKVLVKRPYLRKEWCVAVVQNPTRVEPQGDSRFRFWAPVPALGGRYLRVITLADKVTILNAFPDRGFKP